MKLPHHILTSLCFVFDTADELVAALKGFASKEEIDEIQQLYSLGLPPVTSLNALATMIGVNSGLLWSIANRPDRYYTNFVIKKGRSERPITAPKVALKVIQKWLSHHWAELAKFPDHVYGFVPGRSHLSSAFQHRNAEWVFSVDLHGFFPSTSEELVESSLHKLGYSQSSAALLSRFTCLNGFLVQGAPTSPAISNMCFAEVDLQLAKLREEYDCVLTRYADDIVFSGSGKLPAHLEEDLTAIIESSPWRVARDKTYVGPRKGRNKVHGLLVGSGEVKLTKGYRNRIRMYSYLLEKKSNVRNVREILGHINYGKQLASLNGVQVDRISIKDGSKRQQGEI